MGSENRFFERKVTAFSWNFQEKRSDFYFISKLKINFIKLTGIIPDPKRIMNRNFASKFIQARLFALNFSENRIKVIIQQSSILSARFPKRRRWQKKVAKLQNQGLSNRMWNFTQFPRLNIRKVSKTLILNWAFCWSKYKFYLIKW